ncbi:hypothetical protein F5Y16DRAFT_391200 [Xylariaceae sp. FL0255]|nr:hypothetical protein F5Y16DRAFT_391200 [Xylariaceae sp. FL0255]
MTTSSGQDGFCVYCGHWLNEHTHPKHAKCKKCKLPFVICQTGIHGDDEHRRGWMICSKPCGHDRKYWPDPAKAAKDLPEKCWASTHPRYQTPAQSKESDAPEAQPSTSTAPSMNFPSGSSDATTHQRTLSEESMDPLATGSPVAKGKGRATDRIVWGQLQTQMDELGDDMDELASDLAQFDLVDGTTAAPSTAKTKARKPSGKSKGKSRTTKSKSQGSGTAGWEPLANEVNEIDWTIWDPVKKKHRQVQQDQEGHLYIEKKDGSIIYLQ